MTQLDPIQKARDFIFNSIFRPRTEVAQPKIETQTHFNNEVKNIFAEGVEQGHSADHVAGQVYNLATQHPDFANKIGIPPEHASIREVLFNLYNQVHHLGKGPVTGAPYNPNFVGNKQTTPTTPIAPTTAPTKVTPTGSHQIDDAGVKLVAQFEGFSPTIYNDAAGYPTIGYGHLLKPGEADKFAKGLTKEEGLDLLKSDMQIAANAVNANVKVPLTQNQFNALTSFTFNLGTGALRDSTLLTNLNKGDYASVPGELNKWVHAGGKVLQGLVNRRAAEGELFVK